MNKTLVLLRYNLVESHKGSNTAVADRIFPPLATVISNFYYYGYGISKPLYEDLVLMNKEELTDFWRAVEPALKEITLDNRNIGEHVVYQNFPTEVLNMDGCEYWTKQILMYFGFDKDLFREEKKDRPALLYDKVKNMLGKANERSMQGIVNSLLGKPAKWIPEEEQQVTWLAENGFIEDLNEVPFKENLVFVGLKMMSLEKPFLLKTSTDVLRFIVGLSAGDISLKKNSKIRSFKRKERKFLLNLLSNVGDLEEGIMRHLNKWIRVFHSLHVGDYQAEFPKIYEAANVIRNNGKFPTFNSKVEDMLLKADSAVLSLLATRPGDFARRILHCLHLFDKVAVEAFSKVLKDLPSISLLKLKKLLELYPYKKYKTIAPKGNWGRLQILEQETFVLDNALLSELVKNIKAEIAARQTVDKVDLDERCQYVKLPSNNADGVLPYGRGTVFPIPQNIKFIRTATYWEAPGKGTVWFDNGWNFFSDDWTPRGTVCWNVTEEMKPAAVFSGDPVSGTNVAGKAAQLIDLYLDELAKKGVRFAVWNILCYSRVAFSGVKEVLGLLEMGENATEGKLIEPSRATFAFPVTGDAMTKYICYLDIKKRHLIFLDANLKGNVGSAKTNESTLAAQMPAIVEYLEAQPSVYDIFESVERSDDAEFKVLYDDADKKVTKGYVFRPINENNHFENCSVVDLLKNGK